MTDYNPLDEHLEGLNALDNAYEEITLQEYYTAWTNLVPAITDFVYFENDWLQDTIENNEIDEQIDELENELEFYRNSRFNLVDQKLYTLKVLQKHLLEQAHYFQKHIKKVKPDAH